MRKNLKYKLLGSVFGAVLAITPALATEGMFSNGSGARHRAMAGAGVADGNDASSIALNPASIAKVGNEVNISVTLFNPDRDATFDPDGAGAFPAFNFNSAINWFAIPNMAINYRLNSDYVDSIGLSVSGNGGMNTSYKPGFLGANSTTGIDLQQMFIALAFAKKFNNVSIGVSPLVVRQQFSSSGLVDPTFTPLASNGAKEAVWGVGVRVGAEVEFTPGFRFGASYQPKISMGDFSKFRDVFAISNGNLDIPANVQVGISYDVTPALTVNADFRHIAYNGVTAISGDPALGGFGWRSTNTYKVGLEYDYSQDWTLRAGYSYNTQPIVGNGAINNSLLAPGVVQHHITAGFQKNNFLMEGLSLEVTGSYAPSKELISTGPAPITRIRMDQTAITAGLKWKF